MNPFKTRFFRHYKNKPYRYLGIVHHSETLEELALYETLYENKTGRLWVRPKEMFFENVQIEGKSRPRFEPIEFQIKSLNQVDTETWKQLKALYEASFKLSMNEQKYLSKLEANKEVHLVMAFDQDKPVAMKIGYKLDQGRFYSWLGAVLPDYQGLGIGSLLMQHQHDWCVRRGFHFIETRTRNQFKQMICLNLQNGFEIVGTLKDEKGLKILFEKKLS